MISAFSAPSAVNQPLKSKIKMKSKIWKRIKSKITRKCRTQSVT